MHDSLYDLLVQLWQDLPPMNGWTVGTTPPEFKVTTTALQHLTAVRGWHVRIHGDFWIVGADDDQNP